MKTISASNAKTRLVDLIDEIAESHGPLTIKGERHDAVLISAVDWAGIQETLYLLSVPGMRESIRAGLETHLSKCDTGLHW
jgi:prevent-host-death family protein